MGVPVATPRCLTGSTLWCTNISVVHQLSLNGARLSDHAYEQLKRMIVRGELPPGSLVTERELTARLVIGRTPLREALQRLVSDYFLAVVPGGGYLVSEISLDSAARIYELRRPIEGLSARLAAERATAEDVDALEEFVHSASRPVSGKDGHWHLAKDGEFHDLVARTSRNEYLRSTVKQLFSLTQRVLTQTRPRTPRLEDELPFYETLTELIGLHEPEQAEQVMLEHVRWKENLDGVVLE